MTLGIEYHSVLFKLNLFLLTRCCSFSIILFVAFVKVCDVLDYRNYVNVFISWCRKLKRSFVYVVVSALSPEFIIMDKYAFAISAIPETK